MTKRYCDVCGKEENEHPLHFNSLDIKEIKEGECGCDSVEVDMCDRCFQKYMALKRKLDRVFMTKYENNIEIISD